MPKFPTIHLNGSDGRNLARELREVGHAISELLAAMQQAAPNGRDYYPQGFDATATARREHEARMAVVIKLREEYSAILEDVQRQLDVRRR